MFQTVDITAPFLRWLREPREFVGAYERTRGEIEKAVGAFAASLGGSRAIDRGPRIGKIGFALGIVAFGVAWSLSESGYRNFAIGGAVALIVISTLLSNRTLFLPGGVASERDPLRGKLAYYGGGALVAAGSAVCLGALLSMKQDAPFAEVWLGYAAFVAGVLASGAGVVIGKRGKQLLQPTASELRVHDQRRPIVLLRSFGDDDLLVVTGKSKEGLTTGDFEESIEDQFAPFGPFVAIGKPGEALPALGAARNYYTNAEWQEAVAKWMDEALVLVVIPGLTGGLGWELETIRRFGHFDKLLVLMPPRVEEGRSAGWGNMTMSWSYSFDGGGWRHGDAQQEAEGQETRWDTLRAAFSEIDAFADLPEDRPPGLIAMHLTPDGTVILLTGPEIAWEADFERAIRFALYGMFCHGQVAVEQVGAPLSGAPTPADATSQPSP